MKDLRQKALATALGLGLGLAGASGKVDGAIDGKKTVDQWLDEVDYGWLNDGTYQPTPFALKMVNFIKLVNGEQGESHPSPVVHMAMLDKIVGKKHRIANLCARGLGKTALMIEYLFLYIAVFGEIEGFGEISGMIYVSDSMENGVKSARKNIEFRYNNSEFLKEYLPEVKFTDSYIEAVNKDGHRLGMRMFGAKTGLRGTKIFSKRPTFAVLDDLVSDDDSKSKVAMDAIKDTVYRGVVHALDPTRRKIIFNGTPFNKSDILYEAVESGSWEVNVWPICERFPCTREEFRGAWEERFSYDYVKEEYDNAVLDGKLGAFLQELMLRITNDEDRLVQGSDIRWYNRQQLLERKSNFNFYFTTDYTTSEKEGADFAVTAVWALNNNGDWFFVDGSRERQTLDKSLNDLFGFVPTYRPMLVGIEVTGQQGGFIPYIQSEMLTRNIFFSFATHGNAQNPGVRPAQNKWQRFNLVVPLFKTGKIYFPEEARNTRIVTAFVEEITSVTPFDIKSKTDDCLDNVSMLPLLGAWRPSEEAPMVQNDNGLWEVETHEAPSGMGSYVV